MSARSLAFLFRILFIGLVFLNAASGLAQTKVTMKDGTVYKGTLVDTNMETLTLLQENGTRIVIQRENVLRLEAYTPGGDESIAPARVSEQQQDYYTTFGLTLGTPAGVNLNLGRYFDQFGLRLSGGYWGTLGGIDLNAMSLLNRGSSFTHELFVGCGYLSIEEEVHDGFWGYYTRVRDWLYLEGGWSCNWSGFFGLIGLSVGSGSFRSPQLVLQIGYVHEFN